MQYVKVVCHVCLKIKLSLKAVAPRVKFLRRQQQTLPWLATLAVPTAIVHEIVRLDEVEAAHLAAKAVALSDWDRMQRQTCCSSELSAIRPIFLKAAKKVRDEVLARTKMERATRDEVLAHVAKERVRELVNDSTSWVATSWQIKAIATMPTWRSHSLSGLATAMSLCVVRNY